MLRRLLHEIEDEGALWCPVIVDRESMVVLDGTHRVYALRSLGCRYVCAYFVDYGDPEIWVERWIRAIPKPLPMERIEEIAEGLGLVLIPLDSSKVQEVGYPVLRLSDGSCFALLSRPDSLRCYETMHGFELMLESMGYGIDYDTEADAEERLTHNTVSAVLQPPALEKEQVVSSAVQGHALSCKATRHVIPGRPVGVDVPLTLLKNHEISLEEANARLAALIERKKTETMPPGALWRGRRYDEGTRLFIEGSDQDVRSAPGYGDPASTVFGRSLSRERRLPTGKM